MGDKYECLDSEKYKYMGVTPKELYYRQNDLCWLELAIDTIEGKRVPGCLYCTNGEEYALTEDMLNPTFECIKCISDFVIKRENKMLIEKSLDHRIVSILMATYSVKEGADKEGSEVVLNMSKNTFDLLERHINSTTMFTDQTKPIKLNASGDIFVFGFRVEYADIPLGDLLIQPGNVLIKINEK